MEKKKIKVRVIGLTNSQIQSGAYALVLSDEGTRRLPVIIGMFEAQSIALAIEGVKTPRPLTHDLFISYTEATGYKIKEVFIYKFSDGVYFSCIVLSKGRQNISIDSRTSDAIAIALRSGCKIYTTDVILKECGIIFDENAETEDDYETLPDELTMDDLKDLKKLKKYLQTLEIVDIEERMAKAVETENYEFAKVYKDELLRRQSLEKVKKK